MTEHDIARVPCGWCGWAAPVDTRGLLCPCREWDPPRLEEWRGRQWAMQQIQRREETAR